jgi:hypothetical protein
MHGFICKIHSLYFDSFNLSGALEKKNNQNIAIDLKDVPIDAL